MRAEINTEDVTELRRVQLHLLDAFDVICKKHGFKYWLDFGTLLGAARNGAFIPWDDDIDVSMDSDDYAKFQKIAQSELPDDIFLQTPNTDPAFRQNFIKLRHRDSTFIEFHENENMPYHQGIFIDIFPAYRYPKMPNLLLKLLTRYTLRSRYAVYVKTERVWFNLPLYFSLKFIWTILGFLPAYGYGQTPEDNGYAYSVPLKHLYPLTEVQFEGKKYPAPRDYHTSLRLMYGEDYLTPPPIGNRKPHARKIMLQYPCDHRESRRYASPAPVAVFVYNRLKNTREMMRALQNNYLAPKTDVFIFSDGPKNKRASVQVNAVRDYLKTVTGFRSVTIIERPTNYYIERNIIEGVTDVVQKYGKIIVLEDDGVTAPHFLHFMNDALDFYEPYQRVMHIGTFTFIKWPSRKTFLWRYAENTGGGWATWKDRWDKFEWFSSEETGLNALTDEQKYRLQLDGVSNSLGFLRMPTIPWDICWNIAIARHDGLTVNSPGALTQNNGLYNGTHVTVLNRMLGKSPFAVELDLDEHIIFEDRISENPEAFALLKDFYSKLGKRKRDRILHFFLRILVTLHITKLLKKIT